MTKLEHIALQLWDRNTVIPQANQTLYFDVRPAEFARKSKGINLDLATDILDQVRGLVLTNGILFDFFASVPFGGCPFAEHAGRLFNKPALYIPKNYHGKLGPLPCYAPERSAVPLLIENVTRHGTDLVAVVEFLRENGYAVQSAITIVDHEMGARGRLERLGVKLYSVFTRTNFFRLLLQREQITKATYDLFTKDCVAP